MRSLIAVFAILFFVSPAFAWEKTYNFTSTDWSKYDCNGDTTILQCTLNGAGGEGPGDGGEGDGDAGDGGKC